MEAVVDGPGSGAPALREWSYEAIVAAGLDPAEYEVADGALVEAAGMSGEGAQVRPQLVRLLMEHLDRVGRPARLYDSGRFVLQERPRRERQPDVALLTRERAPARGSPEDRWPIPVAPDLAIELLSPSDSVAALKRKLEDYLRAGTQEAWVVDPDLQTVTVLRPGEPARPYGREDTLETRILPGLRLSLEELFRVLD